jgi:hypothetical protein
LTPTQTKTQTLTSTQTPTNTQTATQTLTRTQTSTPTQSLTKTLTPTPSASQTLTPTPSPTNTPEITESATPTPTITPTLTKTPTITASQTPLPYIGNDYIISLIDEAHTAYANPFEGTMAGEYWQRDIEYWNQNMWDFDPKSYIVFDVDVYNKIPLDGESIFPEPIKIWPDLLLEGESCCSNCQLPIPQENIVPTTRPIASDFKTQEDLYNHILNTIERIWGERFWEAMSISGRKFYVIIDISGSMVRDLVAGAMDLLADFLEERNINFEEVSVCLDERWISWAVNVKLYGAGATCTACTEKLHNISCCKIDLSIQGKKGISGLVEVDDPNTANINEVLISELNSTYPNSNQELWKVMDIFRGPDCNFAPYELSDCNLNNYGLPLGSPINQVFISNDPESVYGGEYVGRAFNGRQAYPQLAVYGGGWPIICRYSSSYYICGEFVARWVNQQIVEDEEYCEDMGMPGLCSELTCYDYNEDGEYTATSCPPFIKKRIQKEVILERVWCEDDQFYAKISSHAFISSTEPPIVECHDPNGCPAEDCCYGQCYPWEGVAPSYQGAWDFAVSKYWNKVLLTKGPDNLPFGTVSVGEPDAIHYEYPVFYYAWCYGYNANVRYVNPVVFGVSAPGPNISFGRTSPNLCDARYDCDCTTDPSIPTGPLRTIFVKWS